MPDGTGGVTRLLSPVLADYGPDMVAFRCPGCKSTHPIRIEPKAGSPAWGFNGNYELPTFTPSVLVRSGHYCPGHEGDQCWCTYNAENPGGEMPFECGVCHSFVTNGQIQFLGDCTHALAGQTVALPKFDCVAS